MTPAEEICARRPARVLALCYMLPPALYPQAIQIGRLLAHSKNAIARVSGPPGQDTRAAAIETGGPPHLVVPDVSPRWPAVHRLALRTVPRYGSVPDEFRAWAARAGQAVLASKPIADFAPEIIVSFGEPMSDHLLGRALSRRMQLPWIAHFSDPWADNPFRRPHKLSYSQNRSLEAGVVEDAGKLIFTSEETRQLLGRFHGEALLAKSRVLPHSFEPALYPARSGGPGARDRISTDRIVVRYLGNFYGRRSPVPLLRALQLMQQRQPELLRKFRFELIGGMPGWMKLHPLVRRADSDVVAFLPAVSYSISLERMVTADVLLVIDAPATESVFLPSKLIDYLGARRPIFGIVPPGTSARVIGGLGGLIADPDDPAGIAEALARIAAGGVVPALPPASGVAEYEAPRVAAAFDGIMADTLGERHNRAVASSAGERP